MRGARVRANGARVEALIMALPLIAFILFFDILRRTAGV